VRKKKVTEGSKFPFTLAPIRQGDTSLPLLRQVDPRLRQRHAGLLHADVARLEVLTAEDEKEEM